MNKMKDIYARSLAAKALEEGSSGGAVDWAAVTGKPTTFAPTTHNQAFTTITGVATEAQIPTLAQTKVTNLTTDLAAKIPKASVTAITAIATPASATAEEIATKVNALIAALKA